MCFWQETAQRFLWNQFTHFIQPWVSCEPLQRNQSFTMSLWLHHFTYTLRNQRTLICNTSSGLFQSFDNYNIISSTPSPLQKKVSAGGNFRFNGRQSATQRNLNPSAGFTLFPNKLTLYGLFLEVPLCLEAGHLSLVVFENKQKPCTNWFCSLLMWPEQSSDQVSLRLSGVGMVDWVWPFFDGSDGDRSPGPPAEN